jgi:threonine dehydrogenase-like Zn-dependent dehydrogenase
MNALLFDTRLHLAELPDPQPGKGEALIKIRYSSICNTDLEIIKGYMGFQGIPGHEFVGEVVNKESGFFGKRVVGEINCSCGKCQMCKTKRPSHCTNRTVLGIFNRPGVFAGYTVLPEKNLHLVPDSVSDTEAVFTEPLAAALEILEQVAIDEKKSVFILGAGKLGLLVAQVFKAKGFMYVLFDPDEEKVKNARSIRLLAMPISSMKSDAKAEICIDCTGNPKGILFALEHVYPRGKVILKTTVAKPSKIDLNQLVINEIELLGSRCGPFLPALEMLEKKAIKTAPMISHIVEFKEIIKGFRLAKKKGTVKVLIRH